MQIFVYAKSGHSRELNRVKRCSAFIKELNKNGLEAMLCTSDFRAGAYAKEYLEISKYTNVDILRNVQNMMQRGDILIYDTDEITPSIKEDIENFCSYSLDLEKTFPSLIDYELFTSPETKKEKALFFGDNDYQDYFLDLVKDSRELSLPLIMGHYFFLGNEKLFKKHFPIIIDEEEYIQTIKETKYLLTASETSILESLSCQNSPVLFLRPDYEYKHLDLIKELNIPIIQKESLEEIEKEFLNIINSYPNINKYNKENLENVIKNISNKFI